jgi:hypothetical protein
MLDAESNCAVTVLLADRDKVQLSPLPEQAPVHLTNCEPVAGLAVSVTDVPCTKDCVSDVQLVLQLMPSGVLVTVP